MKNFRTHAALAVTLAAAGGALDGCRQAVAQSLTTAPKPTLELTVYKSDFAMVRDERKVSVASGAQTLRLPGVSKQLDPQSVLFDWPAEGQHPEVLSTTYNLGVSSSQDLLKRLVGQKVEMVWRGQDGKIGDQTSGVLEEAGQGTVLHTADSYLVDPNGEVVAPANQTVPTMPELVASLDANTPYASDVSLSYLTRGLSWSADYVAKIDPDGKKMHLECWGTITNTTGTDFPAAKLNLVAGNPNRSAVGGEELSGFVAADNGLRNNWAPKAVAGVANTNTIAPTAVGDLYTYKLPSRSDVMQQQMNRAKIFGAHEVPIVRTYSIALSDDLGREKHQNAQVSISFSNDPKVGLGEPMPAGSIRTYEADGDAETYTGAADIADTPKDERVSVTLSDAFDIYATSEISSYKKIARHVISRTYKVVVHNEKKSDETVRIVDSFDPRSKITEESIKDAKLSVGSFEWKVPVKAGGETTLIFTVQGGG